MKETHVILLGNVNLDARECILRNGEFIHVLNASFRIACDDLRIKKL